MQHSGMEVAGLSSHGSGRAFKPCSPLSQGQPKPNKLSWGSSSSSGLEHFNDNFWSIAMGSLKSWGLRWDGSWDLHSPRYKICKQVWSRCGACEQAWDTGLTVCLGYGIWIHGTS